MIMERGKSITTALVAFTVSLVAWSSAAGGAAFFTTASLIEVSATSGDHTATFSEIIPMSSFDGTLPWALSAPRTLSDGSVPLVTITNLGVAFSADPQVDLNFAIVNASLTNPLNITISSATILLLPPVDNAQAVAGASMTLTNGSGGATGGYLTGLFPGGKAYQARYSTSGLSNTSTVFANLTSSLSFSGYGGASHSEALPVSGMTSLGTTVHMMESEFKFTLSPADQATGSSAFVVTPEPASLALSILGISCLLRRRSRR
jgi:hypothetical protein